MSVRKFNLFAALHCFPVKETVSQSLLFHKGDDSMASVLMHIEGKNDPTKNKTLYYADGTIEIRDPHWKLLQSQNIGRDFTMLDMEDRFNIVYEGHTPEAKAKILKKLAKEAAKKAGDQKKLAALEAEENDITPDEFAEEPTEAVQNSQSDEESSVLSRNDEVEAEENEELSA